MSNRNNPFRRIRLVYRRSSPLLKGIVLGTLTLAAAVIIALSLFIRYNRQQTETLRGHAARLEQQNQQLVQNIQNAGTVESIQRIAREELDLVDPEAEFFRPVENNP